MSLRAALVACVFLALIAGTGGQASAAPAAGDTYAYQLVNGYNKEVSGRLRYRVDSVASDRYTVSVAADNASTGGARTEAYSTDGNWLRHALDSHGEKVDYLFPAAYPAYAFPLDPGKTWSVRVSAEVAGARGARSVRVDGTVLGRERIRVPAGEFDTIKVRRYVFPGDADGSKSETRIVQLDWYAPALGRPVRSETRSEFVDLNNCTSSLCVDYGAWDVVELVDAGASSK